MRNTICDRIGLLVTLCLTRKKFADYNTNAQDMGVEADCAKVVEEAHKGLGGLDILISNAVRLVLSTSL